MMEMMDIKNESIERLETLCVEIRERILDVVSRNGGHLSSNLGAVELIVGMHYVFDAKLDPFIFDVSHQSYTHKLLTNRWEEFESLRKFGGISGYTKPNESEFDYFVAGHSSTSISLALGVAKAIKLKGENRIPIAFIGDGALSAGMAYEALNELGDLRLPCVVVLNDNEMSISQPIGALSKYLSQKMAGATYSRFREAVKLFFERNLSKTATYMAKKFEESFKLIMPGLFFEELGLRYIGPIDGHDLKAIIKSFRLAKNLKCPVVVHAQTIKGKGYKIAEGTQAKWHGVGPFDIKNGESLKKSATKSATAIFSQNLLRLASSHKNIVGVTAAMPQGTGLDALIQKFPERFWDVAIAEQHAITSMAAMAKEGFKPYIAIYSTFLQRAYDQIIHDLAIMNLPAVLCIDRAGIVGEDGETHQGAFDIGYLNLIPNVTMCAPRSEQNFAKIMDFSYKFDGLLAIRYPRGAFKFDEICDEICEIEFAKAQMLINNHSKISFIGYGNGVGKAQNVMKMVNFTPNLIDLVFAKPLDSEFLLGLSKTSKIWYVFSDSAAIGGIGAILRNFLDLHDINDVKIESFEYTDEFIKHGNSAIVEQNLGIDEHSIAKYLLNKNYQS